jgi:hypothetical protein
MLVEKLGDNVFPLGDELTDESMTGGLWKSLKVKRHAQWDLWNAFRSGNPRPGRAGKRGPSR